MGDRARTATGCCWKERYRVGQQRQWDSFLVIFLSQEIGLKDIKELER